MKTAVLAVVTMGYLKETITVSHSVAVCIATRNRLKFLAETLTALAKQTFKDFGVYLVWSGSDMKTKAVINRFKKMLDITAEWSEDLGVGWCKNKAVNMALADNQKYIQMVD